jgi:hypothetical protein
LPFQDDRSQASIFRYKKLVELPCHVVLNPLALRFLQNWLDLNDEEQYKEQMLVTLRGLISVANS